jgi:F-box/leucine-rich repeat protein 14
VPLRLTQHSRAAAVGSPAAVRTLASLTRLTWLDISYTDASAGLRHLTRLKDLEYLSLRGCEDVTDEHLQPLSALTGLTLLNAGRTGVQGSSLAALSGLQSLYTKNCSRVDGAGLAAVAQLTRLTFLDLSYSAKGAAPAQLAQLAQLTNLQELWLWAHAVKEQAAALLELPRLGDLAAHSVAVPQGQALISACAITRLALARPAAAELQALPQLPALQSLVIHKAGSGLAGIRGLTQLTQLVVARCEGVQASELAAALQGLKQLQALELGRASCFDTHCLLAVAGLQQLQELWVDGGEEGLAPGVAECWGMLHRCPQLQRLTLQRCGTISQGALVALVSHVQQMALSGAHGLSEEAARDVKALGHSLGCELLYEGEVRAGPICRFYFGVKV